jgi:hypothetical protein
LADARDQIALIGGLPDASTGFAAFRKGPWRTGYAEAEM